MSIPHLVGLALLFLAMAIGGCTRVPLDAAATHASSSCRAETMKVDRHAHKHSTRPVKVSGISLLRVEPVSTATTSPVLDETPDAERERHMAELQARFTRWDAAADAAIRSICIGCLR
jgi:hypothetical protein